MFGNYGRTETILSTNSINSKEPKVSTQIAIKNIYKQNDDMIFDIIYDYQGEIPDVQTINFKLTNYPNPFTWGTKILYTLEKDSYVTLELLNSIGQRVETILSTFQTSSEYEINFGNINMASGVYFFRIKTADGYQIRKSLFVKSY